MVRLYLHADGRILRTSADSPPAADELLRRLAALPVRDEGDNFGFAFSYLPAEPGVTAVILDEALHTENEPRFDYYRERLLRLSAGGESVLVRVIEEDASAETRVYPPHGEPYTLSDTRPDTADIVRHWLPLLTAKGDPV